MHLGDVTAHPGGEWTVQQARNLALTLGERLEDIRFLIRDRGSNFTTSFDAVFQAAGARVLRTAVQARRMNAICERLDCTLRREMPGPRADPRRGTPARHPDRIPGALQPPPGRTRVSPSASLTPNAISAPRA
jgi:hypothetical protein